MTSEKSQYRGGGGMWNLHRHSHFFFFVDFLLIHSERGRRSRRVLHSHQNIPPTRTCSPNCFRSSIFEFRSLHNLSTFILQHAATPWSIRNFFVLLLRPQWLTLLRIGSSWNVGGNSGRRNRLSIGDGIAHNKIPDSSSVVMWPRIPYRRRCALRSGLIIYSKRGQIRRWSIPVQNYSAQDHLVI